MAQTQIEDNAGGCLGDTVNTPDLGEHQVTQSLDRIRLHKSNNIVGSGHCINRLHTLDPCDGFESTFGMVTGNIY